MCDLIDLNNPNAKGALNPAKLMSSSQSATEKREDNIRSGNDPFEQVLHEILQRALKSKDRKLAAHMTSRKITKCFRTLNKILIIFAEWMLDELSDSFDKNEAEIKMESIDIAARKVESLPKNTPRIPILKRKNTSKSDNQKRFSCNSQR